MKRHLIQHLRKVESRKKSRKRSKQPNSISPQQGLTKGVYNTRSNITKTERSPQGPQRRETIAGSIRRFKIAWTQISKGT
jgi:hypothetical protein